MDINDFINKLRSDFRTVSNLLKNNKKNILLSYLSVLVYVFIILLFAGVSIFLLFRFFAGSFLLTSKISNPTTSLATILGSAPLLIILLILIILIVFILLSFFFVMFANRLAYDTSKNKTTILNLKEIFSLKAIFAGLLHLISSIIISIPIFIVLFVFELIFSLPILTTFFVNSPILSFIVKLLVYIISIIIRLFITPITSIISTLILVSIYRRVYENKPLLGFFDDLKNYLGNKYLLLSLYVIYLVYLGVLVIPVLNWFFSAFYLVAAPLISLFINTYAFYKTESENKKNKKKIKKTKEKK